MEEKLRKQKIRMLAALGDFQLANSAAAFLYEFDKDEPYDHIELRRFRCYEQTAIVSYSRPFTQSRGANLPHLSLKQCGVELDQDELELHKRILDLRNKLFAHSDLEMMNFAAAAHKIDVEADFDFVHLHTKFDEGLHFVDFNSQYKLTDLIRKLRYGLYKKLSKMAQSDPDAFNLKVHYPKS